MNKYTKQLKIIKKILSMDMKEIEEIEEYINTFNTDKLIKNVFKCHCKSPPAITWNENFADVECMNCGEYCSSNNLKNVVYNWNNYIKGMCKNEI